MLPMFPDIIFIVPADVKGMTPYLLTSSPVLCSSKKAISCCRSELKRERRSLTLSRSPAMERAVIYTRVDAACTKEIVGS